MPAEAKGKLCNNNLCWESDRMDTRKGALGTAIPPAPLIKTQINYITRQSKDKYYKDGITKVTDPFWEVTCHECGHATWSVLYVTECIKCKSKDITCVKAK